LTDELLFCGAAFGAAGAAGSEGLRTECNEYPQVLQMALALVSLNLQRGQIICCIVFYPVVKLDKIYIIYSQFCHRNVSLMLSLAPQISTLILLRKTSILRLPNSASQ
jgi:hypothetical protein